MKTMFPAIDVGVPDRPGCRKLDCQFLARCQGEVLAKQGMLPASTGLCYRPLTGREESCCREVMSLQSPDITAGVHVGKDDLDVGAGDQGIMFGSQQ